MPPLPETMRFLGRGWWWLHLLSGLAIFCYGWYFGQNRAERKFMEMQKAREGDARGQEPAP